MMRRDEVVAALQKNYGFNTAKDAEVEQKKLRDETIPTMEKKRDGFIAKAQEVINGLNTQAVPGGNSRAAEQTGLSGGADPGGLPQGRTVVGRKRRI
jgi:hypothetical protein